MSDWTAGYVADIGYTYGYYTELNPLRVRLAFLNAGLQPPSMGAACELGFGQGLSANLHAAASVVQWHGTDFNPAQAGFAQELAQVAESGAQLYTRIRFCQPDQARLVRPSNSARNPRADLGRLLGADNPGSSWMPVFQPQHWR